MSTPLPASPDAREQARTRAEASLERNEVRASNHARFGSAEEQQTDYRAACAQFGITPRTTEADELRHDFHAYP